MQFKVSRRRITILTETEQDLAFIEDTLGLKKAGDFVKAIRGGDNIYIEQENLPFAPQIPGGMPQGGMPQGMMPHGLQMMPGAQPPQNMGVPKEFSGQQPSFPKPKTPPQIAAPKPEKESDDK